MNREQAMKLAEAVRDGIREALDFCDPYEDVVRLASIDLAAIVAAHVAQAGQQEPVAVMFQHNEATKIFYKPDDYFVGFLCRRGWVPVPLYAAPPAVAVPDGWQLVPKEPTPRMLAKAYEIDMLEDQYHAMLAAAPKLEG